MPFGPSPLQGWLLALLILLVVVPFWLWLFHDPTMENEHLQQVGPQLECRKAGSHVLFPGWGRCLAWLHQECKNAPRRLMACWKGMARLYDGSNLLLQARVPAWRACLGGQPKPEVTIL